MFHITHIFCILQLHTICYVFALFVPLLHPISSIFNITVRLLDKNNIYFFCLITWVSALFSLNDTPCLKNSFQS